MSAITVDEARGYAKLFNNIKSCESSTAGRCLTEYFEGNFFTTRRLDVLEKMLYELDDTWKNLAEAKQKEGAS